MFRGGVTSSSSSGTTSSGNSSKGLTTSLVIIPSSSGLIDFDPDDLIGTSSSSTSSSSTSSSSTSSSSTSSGGLQSSLSIQPIDKELTEDDLNANRCRKLYSGLYEGIRYYENECQCRASDSIFWSRCSSINAQ